MNVFLSLCLVMMITVLNTFLAILILRKLGIKKLKCGNKLFHISVTFKTKRRTKKE